MDIQSLIQKRFPTLRAEKNFSFAEHTTIGCGGIAALALSPADTRETAELLALRAAFWARGRTCFPPTDFFRGRSCGSRV